IPELGGAAVVRVVDVVSLATVRLHRAAGVLPPGHGSHHRNRGAPHLWQYNAQRARAVRGRPPVSPQPASCRTAPRPRAIHATTAATTSTAMTIAAFSMG